MSTYQITVTLVQGTYISENTTEERPAILLLRSDQPGKAAPFPRTEECAERLLLLLDGLDQGGSEAEEIEVLFFSLVWVTDYEVTEGATPVVVEVELGSIRPDDSEVH